MRLRTFLILPILLTLTLTSACNNSSSNDSLLSSREECDGVPGCVSHETEFMEIQGDAIHVLHFDCPDEAPNIHNIDVDQNDNVNFVVINWTETGVTVKFFNQDPELKGFYQTFLGCSEVSFEESDGIERFTGRTSMPEIPDVPSDIPESTPEACDNSIPDCVNIATKRHGIGHSKTHKVSVHCPDKHFFARHKDHRSSHWVTIVEDPFSSLFFTRKGMDFLVTNWSAFHNHHWQIAIACSSACQYADGGCPCGKGHFGCHNDPGCPTTSARMTECDPNDPGNCWSVWGETCSDGTQWECNTTLGVPCCESCQ